MYIDILFLMSDLEDDSYNTEPGRENKKKNNKWNEYK